jgi:hypothetical protein
MYTQSPGFPPYSPLLASPLLLTDRETRLIHFSQELKHLAKMGVDSLMQRLHMLPEDLRVTAMNNGGGYVNHAQFWNSMAPPPAAPDANSIKAPDATDATASAAVAAAAAAAVAGTVTKGSGGGAPWGKIGAAIDRGFGSFDQFKADFTTQASKVGKEETEGEKERKRQRDRQRERDRDRHTHRRTDTQKQTHRRADRGRYIEREREHGVCVQCVRLRASCASNTTRGSHHASS